MKIPFHKPIFPKNINQILSDSISSGWVTTGPKVKLFEDQISNYLLAKNVVALNSCTAALHLALAAKGLGPKDKFIAPTYTFVSTVEVGEYLGAKPILVDIDPKTYNLDLNQVEDKLREHSEIKAIIPVHFGGQSVEIQKIINLANKYNLFILEDAAHSFETVSNNKIFLDKNHAIALSFYANKNITTGGEGGALVTNDIKLYDKVKKLSLHGMSKDGWKRFQTNGKWEYDVSEMGYKYNMTDIAASFGIDQLKKINLWHKKRKVISEKYKIGFNNIEGIILPIHSNGGLHAWHLYVIRLIPNLWKISRNELIEKINKQGIGTSVHYRPIHMHSYYVNKYGFKAEDFPIAKEVYETSISLPIYPKLKSTQIDYVIEKLKILWQKYRA
jgi:dTDP-4-amino-4,6-dideoxygalactose transaminase